MTTARLAFQLRVKGPEVRPSINRYAYATVAASWGCDPPSGGLLRIDGASFQRALMAQRLGELPDDKGAFRCRSFISLASAFCCCWPAPWRLTHP